MTSVHPNIRLQSPAPRGRKDIIFRQVGEEWLLFDPISGDIQVLNLSAALVWSQCDGETPAAHMAAAIYEAYDQEVPPAAEVQALVMATLQKFHELGLFAEPVERG